MNVMLSPTFHIRYFIQNISVEFGSTLPSFHRNLVELEITCIQIQLALMETLLDLQDTHPSRDFGAPLAVAGCVGLADEMLFPLDFAVCVEA